MTSILIFLENLNAPELAYKTIYNKELSLRGRIFTKEKKYKDFYVDNDLDIKLLDRLNNIKNIEIRSTCQGHSKERPTYIIFRTKNQDLNYIKKIIRKLKQCPNTYVSYDIGMENKYRICVATNTFYSSNNKQWTEWWNNITNYLENIFK